MAGGRTDLFEAAPRAGGNLDSMLPERSKENPCLSCLCGFSGIRKCCSKLGAFASLMGSWLSMPIAGPLRNVLDGSLDYSHVLARFFD